MKRSIILMYASVFVIVSILMLSIYATVQQSYRTAANDPQIQMANDMAAKLEQGKAYIADDSIDLAKSLSPFYVLYNDAGQPAQATGYLDNKFPQVPKGVLNYAKTHGEDWVTWQPRPDVRMAMVVKKVSSPTVSFIAVGRSLREVENRESNLSKTVFISWVLCTIILGVSCIASIKAVNSR